MGGGDLNLKKSWHPSTLKNQERVWKAEQQKAEEDRKMAELQRELREEREREFLQRTAEDSGAVEKKGDTKLDWMYKGPGGHVSREEYLLGRKVDTAFEQMVKTETEEPEGNDGRDNEAPQGSKPAYTIEHEIAPECVVRRDGAMQVDMKRKLMEDPLLLIRKNEEFTRRQITDNPVKMKQLQQLISAIKTKKKKKHGGSSSSSSSDSSSSSESSSSESSDSEYEKKKRKKRKDKKKKKKRKKEKKKSKKRKSFDGSDSSDSSEEDERQESKKAKKVKKKHKDEKSDKKKLKKKKKEESDSEDNTNDRERKQDLDKRRHEGGREGAYIPNRGVGKQRYVGEVDDYKRMRNDRGRGGEWFKEDRRKEEERVGKVNRERERDRDRDHRRSREWYRDGGRTRGMSREREKSSDRSKERGRREEKSRQRSRSRSRSRDRGKTREGSDRQESRSRLSAEEMEKKRQEMMQAAKRRDKERKDNIQRYEEERKKEEEQEANAEKFLRNNAINASSTSIQDRVKSRVGSLQKGGGHMESNFLRK